jgi:hypothetical protein
VTDLPDGPRLPAVIPSEETAEPVADHQSSVQGPMSDEGQAGAEGADAVRRAHQASATLKKGQKRSRQLIYAGAGLIMVLALVELVGRSTISGSIEDQYSGIPAREMSIELPGLGLVAKAGVLGQIDDVVITFTDLEAGNVVVPTMAVEISEADIDVSDLLTAREVNINGADRVHVVASFDESVVARLAGFESLIHEGQVYLSQADQSRQEVNPVLDGRVVHFLGGFASIDLPVPDERWMPCVPIVSVVDDVILLECFLQDLPLAMGGPGQSEPG